MKSIGIFEAKTRFPSLCAQIAATRDAVLVQKHGRPLVVISAADAAFSQNRPDIYAAWKQWEAEFGAENTEFPEVWKAREGNKQSPLKESSTPL